MFSRACPCGLAKAELCCVGGTDPASPALHTGAREATLEALSPWELLPQATASSGVAKTNKQEVPGVFPEPFHTATTLRHPGGHHHRTFSHFRALLLKGWSLPTGTFSEEGEGAGELPGLGPCL